ncbi:MAG: hypothetical protein FWH22_08900 [Fibromonadales bacterium]|nr:hypothetical protein [Fibromonadales bacterium]
MAVRIKPVQATVIRNKNIVRQVIAEVRRVPSSERLAELRKRDKIFMNMIGNING